MPPSSSSLTCLFIFSLWSCKNLYYRVFIGWLSVIGGCNILVAVNLSPGIWNLSWLLDIRFIMFFSSCAFKYSKHNNFTISVCLFLLGFSVNVKHSIYYLFRFSPLFWFTFTHEFFYYFLGLNLRQCRISKTHT